MADFETEKYEFWFYRPKDARRRDDITKICVGITTVERRNFTDDDMSGLKEFFKYVGKWEALVEGGKSLLEELGFGTKAEKEPEKEFGFEKYEMEFKSEHGNRVLVTIHLTREESLRRSKGDTEHAELPIEEISEQLKNVSKWQTLKKAISELKKQL